MATIIPSEDFYDSMGDFIFACKHEYPSAAASADSELPFPTEPHLHNSTPLTDAVIHFRTSSFLIKRGSKFFREMMANMAAAGTAQEPIIVPLPEEKSIVLSYLKFVHSDPEFSCETADFQSLLAFADKYDIPALLNYIRMYLELSMPLDEVDLLLLADRYGFEVLLERTKASALKFFWTSSKPEEHKKVAEIFQNLHRQTLVNVLLKRTKGPFIGIKEFMTSLASICVEYGYWKGFERQGYPANFHYICPFCSASQNYMNANALADHFATCAGFTGKYDKHLGTQPSDRPRLTNFK
ncbi:hypothetical protein HDU93_007017 [Gonapodya sp. JEL0774]|nr:hypothetical protein HDU93_007017 [Gonapodya sp. JEL0774]